MNRGDFDSSGSSRAHNFRQTFFFARFFFLTNMHTSSLCSLFQFSSHHAREVQQGSFRRVHPDARVVLLARRKPAWGFALRRKTRHCAMKCVAKSDHMAHQKHSSRARNASPACFHSFIFFSHPPPIRGIRSSTCVVYKKQMVRKRWKEFLFLVLYYSNAKLLTVKKKMF